MFYDRKKKYIIKSGSSRPYGINHSKSSKHAEHIAIDYCRLNSSRKYDIYIWKFDKKQQIKRANCCTQCKKIAIKYGYNVYTFNEKYEKCTAIIENPKPSLCYLMT